MDFFTLPNSGRYSVAIVYDLSRLSHLFYYIHLSTFLRMCGFLVGDMGAEHGSASIYMRQLSGFGAIVGFDEDENAENFAENDIREKCQSVIAKFKKGFFLKDIECRDCEQILDIFMKHHLWQAEFTAQQCSFIDEIAKEAKNDFHNAFSDLVVLYDGNSPFIMFAICYCKRRILELDKAINVPKGGFGDDVKKALDSRMLMNRLNDMYFAHSKFTSALLQMAAISELLLEQYDSAIKYYKSLQKYYSTGVVASNIHYSIGKLYEIKYSLSRKIESKEDDSYRKEAYDEFGESLKSYRNNYRAAYKVIDHEIVSNKAYEWAAEEYERNIIRLEQFKKYRTLQPIDLQYLYKFYFKCGRIHLNYTLDLVMAEACFIEDQKLKKMKVKEMPLIKILYMKEETAEKCIKEILGRFSDYQLELNREEVRWKRDSKKKQTVFAG